MPYPILLLGCFTLTAVLTGLIWTIQLVHYPGFSDVGKSAFSLYEKSHRKRIFPLVGGLMLAELILTAWLTICYPSIWLIAAAVLLAIIWIQTATVAAPLHFKLEKTGYDLRLIGRLVRSNWMRTISWTLRLGIYTYLLTTVLLAE